MQADGIAPERRALSLAADLRYRGQAFELTIPWLEDGFDAAGLAAVAARFHARMNSASPIAIPAMWSSW